MVEGHIKKGKFGSCLAVCFQGNNHLQMDIIASLGLLVSDVAEEPRRKYILVFKSEPELVKFDLSELLDSDGSRHYPMLSMKKGVTILNGHSKILMKYFLEEGGRMRPEDVMRWAISGEKYKHLVVLD
ncbi:hypothetical protein RHMOL_Rhmol08G0222700 [Rhododendron molle]|uniref:Uncharacterized protein n=1 Tax=Rhododendron molle TaxID=49168 RepID=A0ACC0MRW5_RHOML|nr:hypothetical protein RHMOL_Rhmol08G0222700 [Rhododendron molle]